MMSPSDARNSMSVSSCERHSCVAASRIRSSKTSSQPPRCRSGCSVSRSPLMSTSAKAPFSHDLSHHPGRGQFAQPTIISTDSYSGRRASARARRPWASSLYSHSCPVMQDTAFRNKCSGLIGCQLSLQSDKKGTRRASTHAAFILYLRSGYRRTRRAKLL
jgi:hypothetical protein